MEPDKFIDFSNPKIIKWEEIDNRDLFGPLQSDLVVLRNHVVFKKDHIATLMLYNGTRDPVFEEKDLSGILKWNSRYLFWKHKSADLLVCYSWVGGLSLKITNLETMQEVKLSYKRKIEIKSQYSLKITYVLPIRAIENTSYLLVLQPEGYLSLLNLDINDSNDGTLSEVDCVQSEYFSRMHFSHISGFGDLAIYFDAEEGELISINYQLHIIWVLSKNARKGITAHALGPVIKSKSMTIVGVSGKESDPDIIVYDSNKNFVFLDSNMNIRAIIGVTFPKQLMLLKEQLIKWFDIWGISVIFNYNSHIDILLFTKKHGTFYHKSHPCRFVSWIRIIRNSLIVKNNECIQIFKINIPTLKMIANTLESIRKSSVKESRLSLLPKELISEVISHCESSYDDFINTDCAKRGEKPVFNQAQPYAKILV